MQFDIYEPAFYLNMFMIIDQIEWQRPVLLTRMRIILHSYLVFLNLLFQGDDFMKFIIPY